MMSGTQIRTLQRDFQNMMKAWNKIPTISKSELKALEKTLSGIIQILLAHEKEINNVTGGNR